MTDDARPKGDRSMPLEASTPEYRHPTILERCKHGMRWMWAQRSRPQQLLAGIRHLWSEVLVLTAAVLLGWLVWSATNEKVIIVNAIAVPKALEETGYSSTVVARKVLDHVREINELSRSRKERANISNESRYAALDTIAVPTSGFSVGSMISMLRGFLGVNDKRVGGEVVIKRVGFGKQQYVVILRFEDPSESKPSIQVLRGENADIDEAIRVVARALVERIDPYILATYYCGTRAYPECDSLAERLSLTADSPIASWAVNLRGVVKIAENKPQEAIAFFGKAVQQDPQLALAYANLAQAQADLASRKKGSYAEASKNAALAVQADPKLSYAVVVSARILWLEGKTDQSIAKLEEAIRLNSRDDYAYANLALVHASNGNLSVALEKCRAAVVSNPNNAFACVACGHVYRLSGDMDNATAMFQKATKIDPAYVGAHQQLGYALWAKGEYGAALRAYRAIASLQPTDLEAYGNVFLLMEILEGELEGFKAADH